MVTGPDHRVCANFSLIYGAAALGIEYGILPWKKKATRAAIEKCLAGAFATLRNSSPLAPHAATFASIGIVARKLGDDLDRLTLASVKQGEPCSGEEAVRRQKADGFRIGRKIFIKRNLGSPLMLPKDCLSSIRFSKRSAETSPRLIGKSWEYGVNAVITSSTEKGLRQSSPLIAISQISRDGSVSSQPRSPNAERSTPGGAYHPPEP